MILPETASLVYSEQCGSKWALASSVREANRNSHITCLFWMAWDLSLVPPSRKFLHSLLRLVASMWPLLLNNWWVFLPIVHDVMFIALTDQPICSALALSPFRKITIQPDLMSNWFERGFNPILTVVKKFLHMVLIRSGGEGDWCNHCGSARGCPSSCKSGELFLHHGVLVCHCLKIKSPSWPPALINACRWVDHDLCLLSCVKNFVG